MVIFRENTEDIYAGIEWLDGTPEVKKVIAFLQKEMGVDKIRFPESSSIGIKPVSKEGSERLIRASMRYAVENNRKNVTLVHKGNIQKYTEGMFMKWGYALAKREFSDKLVSWDDCGGKPPAGKILVKDAITDAFLQQILTRPDEFDVIPCCNLTGDLISDALAARKVIERAKGLLMAKEGLTEEEAFDRLRRASQVSGRPLRVIAEAVVSTLGAG